MKMPQVDLTTQQVVDTCKQNQIDGNKVQYTVMKSFFNSGMDDSVRDMAKFMLEGMESELVAWENKNDPSEREKEVEYLVWGFMGGYKMLKNFNCE